jgi:hypothetical protein
VVEDKFAADTSPVGDLAFGVSRGNFYYTKISAGADESVEFVSSWFPLPTTGGTPWGSVAINLTGGSDAPQAAVSFGAQFSTDGVTQNVTSRGARPVPGGEWWQVENGTYQYDQNFFTIDGSGMPASTTAVKNPVYNRWFYANMFPVLSPAQAGYTAFSTADINGHFIHDDITTYDGVYPLSPAVGSVWNSISYNTGAVFMRYAVTVNMVGRTGNTNVRITDVVSSTSDER